MKNVYIAIVIVAVVAVVALSAVFLRGRFSKSEQGAQIPEAATQEEKGQPKDQESTAGAQEGATGEPVPPEIASPMPEVISKPEGAGEPVPVPPKVVL